LAISCWCFTDFLFGLYTDETGIENAAGKTGQEIRRQIKFVGLFMTLLEWRKIQIWHNITLKYLENYCIWQPVWPKSAQLLLYSDAAAW